MYCMCKGSSGEAMPFSAIYVVSGSIGNVIHVKNVSLIVTCTCYYYHYLKVNKDTCKV